MKTSPTQTSKKNNLVPIIIIASLFFIFGFVTWINWELIPFYENHSLNINLKKMEWCFKEPIVESFGNVQKIETEKPPIYTIN